MSAEILFTLLVLASVVLAWWARCSLEFRDIWSIGIYAGSSPYELQPHPQVARQPVLSAGDVNDAVARFVADPFMVRREGVWHMFFEVLDTASRRGVIALATSEDGLAWHYEQVVLREPFHLSYPYVFEAHGVFYMIPECRSAAVIRLYRAEHFPRSWTLCGELLRGAYTDASILQKDGLWWLFALKDKSSLTLHYANDLRGPWIEHPQCPLAVRYPHCPRPGGRLIVHNGDVVRYAQDGQPSYGSKLRAIRVQKLTTNEYEEQEVSKSPVLTASGSGWNANGMHHADVHQITAGHWLACVDGKKTRRRFNWRKGARSMARLLIRGR